MSEYLEFLASKRPKESYFRQACRNIAAAEKSAESLFDYAAA